MGRLDGKIALITGAARGMGAAEVARFTAEGATVIATDVDDERGEPVASELGARYLHLDVTSPAQWGEVTQELRRAHGRLDILVNNAGIPPSKLGRIDEIPLEEHLRIFDVNVHGVFYGIRAVLPLLEAAGRASVVNISSIDGLAGVPLLASYVASKHAVTGLTRSVAIELGVVGIRVNSVHPGVIETPLVAGRGEASRARLQRSVERQPIPRMGLADEVAALVLFLASDESSYCTGSAFTVDGGHLSGPYREPPPSFPENPGPAIAEQGRLHHAKS